MSNGNCEGLTVEQRLHRLENQATRMCILTLINTATIIVLTVLARRDTIVMVENGSKSQ